MKRTITSLAILLAFCSIMWGQEERHEVTIQGSGFFPKETTDTGITSTPTYSGGFLAGYRFNINEWVALEGDYDFFSNSQRYFSPAMATNVKAYVHGITGAMVIKFPNSSIMKPYALIGGGALVFDPRDNNLLESQTRGAFLYGGGLDVAIAQHLSLRGQYRGFVYKAPDFDVSGLAADKVTHAAVPSVGLVFTF